MRVQANAKKALPEVEQTPEIPQAVYCNASKVRQILIDLIANAIRSGR